jgi:hypothetical protein
LQVFDEVIAPTRGQRKRLDRPSRMPIHVHEIMASLAWGFCMEFPTLYFFSISPSEVVHVAGREARTTAHLRAVAGPAGDGVQEAGLMGEMKWKGGGNAMQQ